MKEIKSTIVGVFLILLGAFFIYSDKVDIHSNNYLLYACFGLIGLGIYLLFTTKEIRHNYFNTILSIVKKKVSD